MSTIKPSQHNVLPSKPIPGFLDSFIIILVSAALVLFLLWTASETWGINAFQHLPPWLEESYHAVWSAAATGTAGIGLAIVKLLKQKTEGASPNYLLYILGSTMVMLVLIGLLPSLFAHRLTQKNDDKNVGVPTATPAKKQSPQTVLFQGWLVPLPTDNERVFVNGKLTAINHSDGGFRLRIPTTDIVNVRVCAGQERIFNENVHVSTEPRKINTHQPNGPC
jgi:hypothetical protein